MSSSTSPRPAVADESDSGHLAHLSIPELLSFLKSSFQKADFDKVEKILRCRVASAGAEVERSLSKELTRKETENTELEERCQNLERELTVRRSQNVHAEERAKKAQEEFRVFSMEHEKKHREARQKYALLEDKLSKLEFEKRIKSEELEKYKKMCLKLEELVARQEEDYKIMSRREQIAQEKVALLTVELKRERVNEKLLTPKVEGMDFGSNKRIAGTEMKETIKQVEIDEGGCESQLLPILEVASSSKLDPIVGGRSNPIPGAIIEISDSEDDWEMSDFEDD